MKHLFQKINNLKVLIPFFNYPHKTYYLREIARELRMSPVTVWRYLETHAREGIMQREKRSNGTFYTLKINNKTKALKLAYTLWKLEEAAIVDLISSKSNGLTSILLYGSAARGEDDENSDYDILIIANSATINSLELAERLGREVNLKILSIVEWSEISRKNRAFYLEALCNSISLYGQKPILS
ncbi:MAG TPA: nucleotidyltransferase domain-containing protein [Candidatus Bilamarchaeaceae archaeon]|nr:nucleotidyltransferase domain-containing protein [Candidatus Bilamarchaeaceae archaeon]